MRSSLSLFPLPEFTGRALARGHTPELFRRISKVKITKTIAAATLAALFLPGMPAAQQPLASAEVPAPGAEPSLSPLPSRVVATFGKALNPVLYHFPVDRAAGVVRPDVQDGSVSR